MTQTSLLLAASLTTLAACAAKPTPTSAPASSPPPAAQRSGDDAAAAEVIAQLGRAVQAWHRSCATPNEQGLCIELAPAEDSSLRCAPPMLGRVVVLDRDAELAARAQADLTEVLDRVVCDRPDGCDPQTLRVQALDPALQHDLHRAVAAGLLARADAELEAYFRITMPTDIDFLVEVWKRDSTEPGHAEQYQAQLAKKQDSERRFKEFLGAKTDKAEWLISNLVAVKSHEDQEAVLRAALRTSWTSLHYYDELHGATVPPSARGEPQRGNYCDVLEDVSASARRQAQEAAHYCTMKAAQHGFHSPTVNACQELLHRLDAPQTAEATVPRLD